VPNEQTLHLTTVIARHVLGYIGKTEKSYYPSLLDTGEAAPGALCLVLVPMSGGVWRS